MGAVLEAHVHAHQRLEGFVDQRRRLQGVARRFTVEHALGEPLELLVHEWRELLERPWISRTPFGQQPCDPGNLLLLGHGHPWVLRTGGCYYVAVLIREV